MKEYVRIVAEHAGDQNEPQDTRYKIVFDAVIEGKRLKSQKFFGFAIDEDDDGVFKKWPFILQPPESGYNASLNFGPGADLIEAINVFTKDIEVGSLFTRDTGEDASTYRIVKVEAL